VTTAELPQVTPVRRQRKRAAAESTTTTPRRKRLRRGGASKPRSSGPGLLGPTDLPGPRVRLGILWFLLAVTAATAGRWSSALLWAGTAALAATDLVRVWREWGEVADRPGPQRRIAAAGAAIVVLAAAIGSGTVGVALIVVGIGSIVVSFLLGRSGRPSPELMMASLLPAIAAAPVVLVVVVGPWAAIFLILAVSLYDTGNFLIGAQARHAWEGPVCGIIGVLAVTFTMAAFQPEPFDGPATWAVGLVLALACPLGQAVMTAFLPSRSTEAIHARRLDTYLLAAPLFLIGVWIAA